MPQLAQMGKYGAHRVLSMKSQLDLRPNRSRYAQRTHFSFFLPFFTLTLPQPEVKCVEVIEAPCDDPNETAEA